MTEQIARTEKQLGAILRRARKQVGLTQGALGEHIHLRQGTISRLEAGEPAVQLRTLMETLSALDLELVVRPRSQASACAHRGPVLMARREGARPPQRVPERTPRRRAAPRIHRRDRLSVRRRLARLAEHLSGLTVPAAARRPLYRRTGHQRLRQPASRQRQYPQARRRARRRAWHRRLQPADRPRP